jgi:hypothetical protein
VEDEGRKGVLIDGVLLLKPREAVAEAAETVGGGTVGGEVAVVVSWAW